MCGLADRIDRILVGLEVSLRVMQRACALAEHVVGTQSQLRLICAALQRLLDRTADHELATDNTHRTAHCEAHDRLARLAGKAPHPAGRIGLDRRIEFKYSAG